MASFGTRCISVLLLCLLIGLAWTITMGLIKMAYSRQETHYYHDEDHRQYQDEDHHHYHKKLHD